MTMPTDLPQPTGQTQYKAGAVYASNGTTQLTATSAASLITAVVDPDPPVIVTEDIYQSRVPDGTVYPAVEMVLLFHQGEQILTSQWNAAFPLAVVDSVSPASGPAAGGTVVTLTGQGFTPGTTVKVGGTSATGVTVLSPVELTFTTPSGTDGAAALQVINDGGTLNAGTGLFSYVS